MLTLPALRSRLYLNGLAIVYGIPKDGISLRGTGEASFRSASRIKLSASSAMFLLSS